MRERLRGRNLAHIGCFFGLVLGLSGGIVLAGVLALHNVSVGVVLLAWIALATLLGLIGYAIGTAVSDPSTHPPEEDIVSANDR